MRFSSLSSCAWLHVVNAQRWRLDQSLNPYQPEVIKAAIAQAVEIARVAVDVLEKDYNDEKVQSMLKYIIDDDADEDDVKVAKDSLQGVAKYNTEEVSEAESSQPNGLLRFTDIIFVGDTEHLVLSPKYEDPVYVSQITGLFTIRAKNPELWTCSDPKLESKQAIKDKVPAAFTQTSEGTDPSYDDVVAEYEAEGLTPPRQKDYYFDRPDYPAAIQLCVWWLKFIQECKLSSITDEVIATLADPDSDVPEAFKNTERVNILIRSMPGIMLHELTHTRLGTWTDDASTPTSSCYGWYCIGVIQIAYNADSVVALAISLFLYRKGYWVDEDGDILKIDD